jgi:hypothetical protein
MVVFLLISSFGFYIKNQSSFDESIKTTLTYLRRPWDSFSLFQSPEKELTQQLESKVKKKYEQGLEQSKINLFTKVSQIEETQDLMASGFTYTEIIKLQVISEILNKTIDELLLIDGGVSTSTNGQKKVNIGTFITIYNLSNFEMNDLYNGYKDQLDKLIGLDYLFNE